MSRTFVLAWSIGCYALFLMTFLGLLGFVGRFPIPVLYRPPTGDAWPTALLVNVGLLLLFACQHSVMARPSFKQYWKRVIPAPIERSTYVLSTCVVLWLLWAGWRHQPLVVWNLQSVWLRTLCWGGFVLGWLTVLVTTFLINHWDLFGLRQGWLYFRGVPYRPLPFVTPGPYRLIRHPLYVGWMLAFWSLPTMTLSQLLFAGGMTLYILGAIILEERDLIAAFPAYRTYQRAVPMLVPNFLQLASLMSTGWARKPSASVTSARLPGVADSTVGTIRRSL